MRWFTSLLLTLALVCSLAIPANAGIFYFSTGEPDGLMAVRARADTAGETKRDRHFFPSEGSA